MFKKGFILLLLLSTCHLHGSEWYSEYWQRFLWTMWKNDSFVIRTFTRFDTGDHFQGWNALQINEQFAWKASDDLTLELHYAYLHNRSIVAHSPWRWQNRIELEANRKFHPSCHFEIRTRNRLEIRRVENEPKTLYMFRQQTMLFSPLKMQGGLKPIVFTTKFFTIFRHPASRRIESIQSS